MITCKNCIYYERCDTIFDGLLSNRNNEPCGQFDNSSNYVKLPCQVGDTIYFIGYGKLETLVVDRINIEFANNFLDNYLGYVEAVRADNTQESIGFNIFGELVFTNKEEAEKVLYSSEVEHEYM